MKRLIRYLSMLLMMGWIPGLLFSQDGFRVWPYLQHPAPDSMTLIWFSETELAGILEYQESGSQELRQAESLPVLAGALAYSLWEDTTFFGGEAPAAPYKHRVRLGGLKAGTTYEYRISQGEESFASSFRTAPEGNEGIRFIVYSDSETEPESTGNKTSWPDPASEAARRYLVDQSTGYSNNLAVIRSRNPDLVLIAGDLTQHGGEQRDWDEFWLHNTDSSVSQSLAGQAPLIAVPGNHDYFEGTFLDGYSQPGSERAMGRYLTYFEFPKNGAPNPAQEGRYHHLKYGPASIVSLDLCNNGPNASGEDTNFHLLGEQDSLGGNAPDFGIGSTQYEWLENQLKEAQENSLFTFVMFHHIPYSSGPHAFPPGIGDTLDTQSGVPARVLIPLFLKYGVDAVFCGHDEMWERSEISGMEVLPDNSEVNHTLSFYDVGVGGDGLRGPVEGTHNEHQVFLVHNDAPELWEDSILVEGGKHYGHLEVDIVPVDDTTWNAVLTPVYVLPVYNREDSTYGGYERREYDDQLVLSRKVVNPTLGHSGSRWPVTTHRAYPNPFQMQARIDFTLQEAADLKLSIWDGSGKQVRVLLEGKRPAGLHTIPWDGKNQSGIPVSPGLYLYRIETKAGGIIGGRMVCIPYE